MDKTSIIKMFDEVLEMWFAEATGYEYLPENEFTELEEEKAKKRSQFLSELNK